MNEIEQIKQLIRETEAELEAGADRYWLDTRLNLYRQILEYAKHQISAQK